MKMYNKPMLNIEKIDVQDVITSSAALPKDDKGVQSALSSAGLTTEQANNTIVFEW